MKIIAVYTQLKQLRNLLKMYFPQYKCMTFMYSYHTINNVSKGLVLFAS